MKRVCLLVLCLALTLMGCEAEPAVSDPVSHGDIPQTDVIERVTTFTLAYNHDDTLNPYAAASEANFLLAPLLYDSPVLMGEGLVPQLSLAAAVDTSDPAKLVMTLRSRTFSDGTAVTAADVVTSFWQAKASINYRALLTNVTSATVVGEQVVFTLASPDVNGLACLCFPVVKKDTLTTEAATAPVGSGAYVYQFSDNGARLVAAKGVTAAYPTVQLRHLPNSTSMYYALAGGDITYYYTDMDDGELPQRSGASTAVDTNGLLFLGINSGRGKLADATVRRALSLLLDRQAITATTYGGLAVPSQLPFHPKWQTVAALQLPSAVRDLDGGVSLLDQAGCPANGGKRLELELIYCIDRVDRGGVAELVRTQLEGGGVALTLMGLTEEEYRTRLKKGEYDLYLGEIRLTADMSLRPLLTAGGDAAYGVNMGGGAVAAYRSYLAGEVTAQEFLQTFGAELPFIPLCWRCGFAAYDRRLTVVTPNGTDPYFGLTAWQ